MSDEVLRAALWANDLTRVRQPQSSCGDYVLVEVLPDRLASQLAAAMAVEEPQVLGRLERGCRAFAAWDWRDEVVGWLWVSTGEEWAPPLRRTLRFPDGDCYGWDVGTLERHRGQGLFTGLMEYAGWHMAQQGCHTMWGGILDSNLASQRASTRAGTRPILRLVAHHQPPPTRIETWPADYADERLVERARLILGDAAGRCGR
jgi:GNAT superfamily N-acetyltransferase